MTGVANLSVEVGAQQLELLHLLVPTAAVIALLVNPNDPILAASSLFSCGPSNINFIPRKARASGC
jgi:hypothetical protein